MSNHVQPTKFIKTIGISLFLMGLFIFLGSLFVSNYTLNKSQIKNVINDDALYSSIASEIDNESLQKIDSKYDVVEYIRTIFNSYNAKIKSIYSISANEEFQIIERTQRAGRFTFAIIDSLYKSENEVTQFKNDKLKVYTSWIAEQTSLEVNQSIQFLKEKIAAINQSIDYSKGVDSYRIESFLTPVVKHATTGIIKNNPNVFLFLTFGLMIIGGLLFIVPDYNTTLPGIKNDKIYTNSATNGGFIGLLSTVLFVGFYVYLYFYEYYVVEWTLIVEPIKQLLGGADASRWFVYGLLYTLSMCVMGLRMIIKYRHNNYQLIRTLSVIFFQVCLAFTLPEILSSLNLPSTDLKNIWPLDYDFFDAWNLKMLTTTGGIGIFMLVWGITLFVIGVPVLTYFFGKRWYCSWVCGCGGLAETVGDPYRQLSDKSLKAWKVERISIHTVLIFSVVMTTGVLYTYFTDSYTLFGMETSSLRSSYGFLIGSIFSGVVGTGFYPKMGSRVWCRFGCPLAAYLGIMQRFKSRFRITTNGGQCISCGNCSTYCEMGIDVRSYAQRGEDIVRASCVGCGICSAVCPRGVLKLENGTVELDYEEINKG